MPDLDNHEAVGTNGTTTHTSTESITNATPEQSDESNLETTPAATEQIEAEVLRDVAVEEKSLKPANGEFETLFDGTAAFYGCFRFSRRC